MTLAFALNPLVRAVDAPPIPAAQVWKSAYSGHLGPMIDLSQAVPGTPPPQAFLDQLADAAKGAESARYGPILGDVALREAHATATARIYGGSVLPSNVAITSGCNQAFVITMMALARAGEAVILPAPWYFNHAMTLSMLGIEAKVLPTRHANGFVSDPVEAERLIDSRTRAIILVSPNNPTGAVYPPEVLARFRDLAREKRIALVLDETYRDFLPNGQERAHQLITDPDWGDTLIQLYSFSKAYAIPGHRLGSVIAAPDFIAEIEKILDCVQICPARSAQRVVAKAIETLADWRQEQRIELSRRALACREALAVVPEWRTGSVGAYFAYVSHPHAAVEAVEVARRLAIEGGVLGLPGSYFGPGQQGYLRIAFANVDAAALGQLPDRLRALQY